MVPLPSRALHADGGAVRVQDALDDREAPARRRRSGAWWMPSTWWKRLKIFADLVARDADPGVAHADLRRGGARRQARGAASTVMQPPSGVNLIALMTRFSSTAASFSRSAMTRRQVALHLRSEAQPLLVQLRAHRGVDLLDQRAPGEGLEVEGDPARCPCARSRAAR